MAREGTATHLSSWTRLAEEQVGVCCSRSEQLISLKRHTDSHVCPGPELDHQPFFNQVIWPALEPDRWPFLDHIFAYCALAKLISPARQENYEPASSTLNEGLSCP